MCRLHRTRKVSWLAAGAATLLSMWLARAAQAVPVLITTEGLPGFDIAQRDLAGALRLYAAQDDDANGVISFVADLDPVPGRVSVHVNEGPAKSMYLSLYNGVSLFGSASVPFLITGTTERVITNWVNLPLTPFVIGQPFSVAGGQIPGLDAVVYLSPGAAVFDSADDIVDLDLTTLPLYTGPLQVGGLVNLQVVPEPSTLALAALGTVGLLLVGHRRQRGSNIAGTG